MDSLCPKRKERLYSLILRIRIEGPENWFSYISLMSFL